MNNAVFVGFMGSGKTTVSKALYSALKENVPQLELVDTDAYIEEKLLKKISDIFAEEGEAFFRDTETEVLKELACIPGPVIVSCGGGIVERRENIALLKSLGTVVFIDTDVEILWERVGNDDSRPLSKDKEKFYALYERRRNLYREASDVIIDSGSISVEECVKEVISHL